MSDFIRLMQAVAWPLVALLAVILLRKPLAQFVSTAGQRVTKLSIFQVAIELSAAHEMAPTWTIGTADARQLSSSQLFDSPSVTLFHQIGESAAVDYAVIDLGCGNQWLTSRLFIFSVLLTRLRALRCFVFLSTERDTARKFWGTAGPSEVRWSLAMRYPWLEAAYAQAYSGLLNPIAAYPANPMTPQPYGPGILNSEPVIRSEHGGFDAVNVGRPLVQFFLAAIQTPSGQTPVDTTEWVPFTDQGQTRWEHASWLNQERAERDLGRIVQRRSWMVDSPDTSDTRRAEAILRRDGPFVALLDIQMRFLELVDREVLLEKLASQSRNADR